MDSTALFSKTPPLKLFFTAALPGAVSMLASSLYQLIDGIFVGNFLDNTSFAALNLAMPFVIINFALSDLVGVGSSVPISVALGRGDRKEADNVFTCACILILGAGLVMGAAMFAAAPFLIGMMGAEGDFAAQAVQYLRTYALCSPFTTILYAVDNYLRISGYIRVSMCINILMSVLCVTFEFLFLGVLDLGLWAAAFGASLGMFICVVLAFIPFVRGKALLHFVHPRFEARILRQIVACGSPTFLNNIAGRVTSILMNLFLVRLGGELAVSVYGVLMYVEGFILPLMYGMCAGGGLQLGRAEIQPGAGHRKVLLCRRGSHQPDLGGGHRPAARPHHPALHRRGGGRSLCHGRHGPAAVQPDLSDPLALLRHPELYAGGGKGPARLHHLGLDGAGLPGAFAGDPLAAGAGRAVDELPHDLGSGRRAGRFHPAPAVGQPAPARRIVRKEASP